MQRFIQFLTPLLINAVPAAGWFLGDWSGGTILALYWFENVVATLCLGLRIALHQKRNPQVGHFKYRPRKGAERGPAKSFLSFFLPTNLIFSMAHGFFLAVILLILSANGKAKDIGLNWENVGKGGLLMMIFLIVELAVDLPQLKRRSFQWLEQRAEGNLARVIIVHLSIIFGMLAVAMTGATRSFFGVFIVLKTLYDINTMVPQWNPKEPPKWLCRLMDKAPHQNKSQSFAQFWQQDQQDELAQIEHNNKPAVLPPKREDR